MTSRWCGPLWPDPATGVSPILRDMSPHDPAADPLATSCCGSSSRSRRDRRRSPVATRRCSATASARPAPADGRGRARRCSRPSPSARRPTQSSRSSRSSASATAWSSRRTRPGPAAIPPGVDLGPRRRPLAAALPPGHAPVSVAFRETATHELGPRSSPRSWTYASPAGRTETSRPTISTMPSAAAISWPRLTGGSWAMPRSLPACSRWTAGCSKRVCRGGGHPAAAPSAGGSRRA